MIFRQTQFRPVVLCYHGVSQSWRHPLAIPTADLLRHVRGLLRRGYRPATANEVVTQPQRRLMHVTFDDAFTSVPAAISELAKLGVPSTVFACSSHSATGAPLFLPELEGTGVDMNEITTMTWDQLRDLASQGVEIGSHTVTHPHLSELGESELLDQLAESKARIEDELSLRCRFLAYPYGDYDQRVQLAAYQAGYEAAFAVHTRWRDRADRFSVPRVYLYDYDGPIHSLVKTVPAAYELARATRRLMARAE